MLMTVLIVILVLVLVGGVVPLGGINSRPFYGTGYWGGGGLGFILIILLIVFLVGRF